MVERGGKVVAASEAMSDDAVVHILGIEAGLGCDDGDGVALTAAARPTVEESPLGARGTSRSCGGVG